MYLSNENSVHWMDFQTTEVPIQMRPAEQTKQFWILESKNRLQPKWKF